MNRAEALVALDRLRELIDNFGGPYSADLSEFKKLIFKLRSGPLEDPYFREKLSDLEDQAEAGFSARKFTKSPGGLSQVKVWALGAYSVARDLVEERWPT